MESAETFDVGLLMNKMLHPTEPSVEQKQSLVMQVVEGNVNIEDLDSYHSIPAEKVVNWVKEIRPDKIKSNNIAIARSNNKAIARSKNLAIAAASGNIAIAAPSVTINNLSRCPICRLGKNRFGHPFDNVEALQEHIYEYHYIGKVTYCQIPIQHT